MIDDTSDICPDCLQQETNCACQSHGWGESEAVPTVKLDKSTHDLERRINGALGQPLGESLDLFGSNSSKETPIQRTLRMKKLQLLR